VSCEPGVKSALYNCLAYFASRLHVLHQICSDLHVLIDWYSDDTTYCKQAASLTVRNNRLAHSLGYQDPNFGLFWGVGLLIGYLATSSAKFDVIFLLGDPDFL